MKIFTCPQCGGSLFFDNAACSCGLAVAYDPTAERFVAASSPCANREVIGCNWVSGDGGLCRSCAMTAVHPDLAVAENGPLWSSAEFAKRWVIANLMAWGWFTDRDPGPLPEFRMLAESTASGETKVIMGHASGVVTINLAEADAAERIRRRDALGEPYRTMIGHFRHELAHYLFERLAACADFVPRYRELFGDETWDYGQALDRYYQAGPPSDWQNYHVTPYAAAHPHEDWAESASHILHVTDIVDSFAAARLSGADLPSAGYDAYAEADAKRLIGCGIRLCIALNHVNRAMGLSDLYPFVNSPVARQKLAFAHGWLRGGPPR